MSTLTFTSTIAASPSSARSQCSSGFHTGAVPLSNPAVIEDYYIDPRCQPYAKPGVDLLHATPAPPPPTITLPPHQPHNPAELAWLSSRTLPSPSSSSPSSPSPAASVSDSDPVVVPGAKRGILSSFFYDGGGSVSENGQSSAALYYSIPPSGSLKVVHPSKTTASGYAFDLYSK